MRFGEDRRMPFRIHSFSLLFSAQIIFFVQKQKALLLIHLNFFRVRCSILHIKNNFAQNF